MKLYGITKCRSCNKLLIYRLGDIWKHINLEELAAMKIHTVPAAICPCGNFAFPLLPPVNKALTWVKDRIKSLKGRRSARHILASTGVNDD